MLLANLHTSRLPGAWPCCRRGMRPWNASVCRSSDSRCLSSFYIIGNMNIWGTLWLLWAAQFVRGVAGDRSLLAGRGWLLTNPHKTGVWNPNQVSALDKIINTDKACPKSDAARLQGTDCMEHCRKQCEPYYRKCNCKGRDCFAHYCRTATNKATRKPFTHRLCTCKCSTCTGYKRHNQSWNTHR